MKYYKLFFFILVPFLLLLPLFYMNTSEIAKQENRTLAKFPETTKKDKLNYEFGKGFESWLGDRFWGRDQLIDIRFQAMYKINGRIENNEAFIGDDGWMFEKHGIIDLPSLEKQREKIEKDADILKRFDDKFKGKNVPIYLVLIPDRNQLYQKYWERYYTPKPRLDYGDELIKALKDHPNIHIIYPKEEFIKNKSLILYDKRDIHLTPNGLKVLIAVSLEILEGKRIINSTNINFDFLEHTLDGDLIARKLGLKKINNSRYTIKVIGGKNVQKNTNKIHSIAPCYNKSFFPLFKELFKTAKKYDIYSLKKNGTLKIEDGIIFLVSDIKITKWLDF